MELQIARERFFNNGALLLPSLTDAAGAPLRTRVQDWLERDYDLVHKARKNATEGIDAKQLNVALRAALAETIAGIHLETHVEYGAFFHQGTNGFDFSLYDEEDDLIRLRNAFLGDPGRYGGLEALLDQHRKLKLDREELRARIEAIGGTPGQDVPHEKRRLTVVGELQFGNWALVKHDLLRLLNCADEVGIDYYIYIAATGRLLRMLSQGVVDFDRATEAVVENRRLLKTPMWVIGLDVR